MGTKKAPNNKGKVIQFMQDGEYYFHKGLQFYHNHQLEKAKKSLQRAVHFDSQETTYACQLAAVLAEMGEYQQSNEILEDIVTKKDPQMVECYFFIANNYAHLGWFKEAQNYALKYIERAPDGEFVDETKELLDIISDEFGQMLQEIVQEDELIVDHDQARYFIETGQFYLARERLMKMKDDYPEFWPVYNHLALTYFYTGEYDVFLEWIDYVLTRNPGNLHALCNLAIYYYHTGNQEKCESMKQRLRTIYPIDVDQRFKLGSTLALLGDYDIAFSWLWRLYKQGYDRDAAFYYWLHLVAVHTNKGSLMKDVPRAWKYSEHASTLPALYHYEEKQDWYRFVLEQKLQDAVPSINYRSALYHMINRESKALQLYGLFLNEQIGDDEAYYALNAICTKQDGPLLIKELAALMMFSIRPFQYVVLADHGMTRVLYDAFDCSEDSSIAYDLLCHLFDEIDPHTFDEIEDLFQSILQLIDSLHKWSKQYQTLALAAAFDYVWKKSHGMKITQQMIAEHYYLSLSTVRKYVKIVRNMLTI